MLEIIAEMISSEVEKNKYGQHSFTSHTAIHIVTFQTLTTTGIAVDKLETFKRNCF